MSTIFPRAAFGLGLCLFLSAPALAEPEARSATVHVADLNLATPEGESALRSRLSAAATQVCGDVWHRQLEMRAPIRACRASALAAAEPQIVLAMATARRGEGMIVADLKVAARKS